MTNIALKTLERLTTNSNLERGKSYYYSGQVRAFKIINDQFIEAIVNGGKGYRVFLEKVNSGFAGYCNCPYDSKGYCKHKVAVKIALMDAPEEAELITISEIDAIFLKFYHRSINLFYRFKYKIF